VEQLFQRCVKSLDFKAGFRAPEKPASGGFGKGTTFSRAVKPLKISPRFKRLRYALAGAPFLASFARSGDLIDVDPLRL
jgi:hypothetical protein